jgi:DNA-binding NarL/FixJ family response regulator
LTLLVARGLSNKEVGRELHLSDGTVKQHVHNIFLKLRTQKRRTLTNMVGESAVTQNAKR